MRKLIVLLILISLSIFGYSTKALNEIITSDKDDATKVKEVLKLDKELKKDIQKIVSFKKQYIKKYKKIAASTMKDKSKTNYDKMIAWQNFTDIAEGTKYAKSGKRMVYKFSKKAQRDLAKELKKEELEADRDYNKIVSILDKILNLKLRKKEEKKYEKKRGIYQKKIHLVNDNGHRSSATMVTGVAVQHRPEAEAKAEAKAEAEAKAKAKEKEEKKAKKSSVSHKHSLVNKEIQNFRATVYNKDTVKINMLDTSDYIGINALKKKKLILLTFYANYCKPCKKELPFLNKLYAKYKNKGFLVVAVNTDKDKDEREEVKQFIIDKNLQYPVLKDSYNLISRRYQIENFPTMFLINGEGKILEVTIGYDEDEEGLENKIKDLLK